MTFETNLSTAIPGSYRQWIKTTCSTIAIETPAHKGKAAGISLPAVYIPLETVNPFHKNGEGHTVNIETLAARQNCIFLCGDTGMGKTALVKHLAWTIIMGSSHGSLNDYLPVIVSLKHFGPLFYREKLKNLYGSRTTINVEGLLTTYLKETGVPLGIEMIRDFLLRGKALFLFDGLDEIPLNIQPELADMLAVFQSQHSKTNNRFLLTGRTRGLETTAVERFEDYLQHIEYLDDHMVGDFVSAWFKAVSASHFSPEFKTVTSDDFLPVIRDDVPVFVLTRNPFLLTAACILYQYGKCILGNRVDIDEYIIKKLAGKGIFFSAKPAKSKALIEFLLFMYAEISQKNLRTCENYNAHELLKNFLCQ
jgi:energy-coupling factor transporter ATP-binding protein EcfA2